MTVPSIPPEPAKPARARVSGDKGATIAALIGLWPYLWPVDRPDLKRRVILALAALVVAKLITVLVPYSYKWATDALVAARGAGVTSILVVPIMLVVAYGVGRIMMNVFNQLRDGIFAKVNQHAVRKLGYRTFVHMHDLSLRFHLQRRTGGLARVIARGTNGIDSIVDNTILMTFPTILEFALMATVITYQFNFLYVIVVAVTVCLYIWFSVVTSNRRIAIRRDMNESDNDANAKAVDSLINFETVKYFGNEGLEAGRFDRAMTRYEAAAVKASTSLAWLNIGQTFIFTAGMTVCMVLTAGAVMRGEQTLGDFVLINALLIQLAIPLNFIGVVYREIKQGLIDVETMFDLLAIPPEVEDKPGAKPLAVSEGRVRFENVSFSYDPSRAILKNVSFEIAPGQTVAIVGPSGAGKSTISRLLYRFYDIGSGAITIDGQDIRDVTQASVRSAIGIVPQDTVLFNDTIGYNIRYGRPDATDAEIRAAAEMAQIAGFVEQLEKKYETEVGERGLKLSGGEKQRVAIARTILKGPPILILDEATSALDTHTEREIQAALDRAASGRTALVIAHRLSTVIGADEIIVLEAGRIVERGRHAELLTAGGLYASMWNRQREAAEAEERLRRAEETDTEGYLLRPRPAEPVPG